VSIWIAQLTQPTAPHSWHCADRDDGSIVTPHSHVVSIRCSSSLEPADRAVSVPFRVRSGGDQFNDIVFISSIN